jgi:hypothetical protein
VIGYYSIQPKNVEYYELDYGVIVNSSEPNMMDAFTVSAYIRNDNNRFVQVKPFRYSFTIVDASRVNNTGSNLLKQDEILKLRPNEKIILHEETIFPQTEKIYHISVLGKTTSLTVEGWYNGLSHEYSMSKSRVTVYLEKYTWKKDETPKITVHNEGESMITIGVGYRLQKYVNETWIKYSPTTPEGDMFIAVGIGIGSGGVYSHKVVISHLEDGHYRLVKSVSFESGRDHMLNYMVEFQIIDDDSLTN